MIVPTNRLLFWFAAIALPFSALGALHAEAMLLSIALIAALLVIAVVDAALAMRDFVTPDDVKTMTTPVLEHRLILRPEFEIEGMSIAEVIQSILQQVAVPR